MPSFSKQSIVLLVGSLVLVISLVFYFTSDLGSSSGQAVISCANLEKYYSPVGKLNISSLSIGDVFILDTDTDQMARLTNLNVPTDKLQNTTETSKQELNTDTKLKIAFSGDLEKADQNIKAQIENTISSNTVLIMRNSIRTTINDVVRYLNYPNKSISIKDAVRKYPNHKILVVTSMIYTDSLDLRLQSDLSSKNQANILNVGKFNVKVIYNCSALASLSGKRVGALYKYSEFEYDKTQGRFLANVFKVDPETMVQMDSAMANPIDSLK